MSFIFTDNSPFEWPVEISVPKEGGYTTVTITGLFSQIGDDVFLAPPETVLTNSTAIDFEIDRLCKVFTGWKTGDVKDLAKAEIEPTPENIRKFLMYRPARLAVLDAYQDAITPKKGYRAKNSAPLPS